MPLGTVVEALLLLLLERRVAGVAGHRRHLGRPSCPLGSGLDQASAGGRAGGGGGVRVAVAKESSAWSCVSLLCGSGGGAGAAGGEEAK